LLVVFHSLSSLLVLNCQASSSIEEVVRKGYLTNHFTAEEIKARWHAILYDQPTAEYVHHTYNATHTTRRC